MTAVFAEVYGILLYGEFVDLIAQFTRRSEQTASDGWHIEVVGRVVEAGLGGVDVVPHAGVL